MAQKFNWGIPCERHPSVQRRPFEVVGHHVVGALVEVPVESTAIEPTSGKGFY